MKAAERLIAEHGYESTSIRAIVAKARVNQAAINYHFAGKEGLYREILRAAFRALTAHQLAHAEEAKTATREAALGAFVRRQLQPLSARRIQPASADFQLGSRATDRSLSQAHERGGGTVHERRRRPRAPLPA